MYQLVSILILMLSSLAVAEEAAVTPPAEAEQPAADELLSAAEPALPTLEYRTGEIALPSGVATLSLGADHRYLDPAETNKLLMLWGNPPDETTEGAIVHASVDPLTPEGWAVILTYSGDGHVSDEEAAGIDYDELLSEMQEETVSANEWREEQGYGRVELLGWAARPNYDSAAKKLVWAKELQFSGSEGTTLNYDVRVLGREGVLSMNAVASTAQLAEIEQQMQALLPVANFNSGQRYADFDPETDRVAGYGIAALVAGGLAAKSGLLAKVGLVLAKGWKLVALAVVGIGVGLRKFLASRNKSPING